VAPRCDCLLVAEVQVEPEGVPPELDEEAQAELREVGEALDAGAQVAPVVAVQGLPGQEEREGPN
jgi:hypothetical protein